VTTNRDLPAEVAAGRFRGDLYYRLNVVRIWLPPLRERMEDIPVLAETILRPLAKELGRPAMKISPRALKKLGSYSWPGNVRELRNVLERAMLIAAGNEIRVEDLVLENPLTAVAVRGDRLPQNDWEIRTLDDVIAEYVAAAVEATGGNIRAAARKLAITPSTLYSRLKAKQ
jgi:DNA-binding NtrC family response regulator